MEKKMPLYINQSEFDSNKEELNQLNHYTALKKEEKELEYKSFKVELPIKDISESIAADICIVENNTLNKCIVDGTTYSTDLFPLEQYTPIGVVVVPASHTEDGTARVMSLASMDYNNPEVGSTDGHVGIAWGGYDSDISTLPNLTQAPYITNDFTSISGEQELLGFTGLSTPYFSSDQYTDYPNPYDEGTYFYTGTTSSAKKGYPSPYLTGGAKNEIYHDTSNTSNSLADMGGKSNTEKILSVDNSTDTSWQTASTITNNTSSSTNTQPHSAAQCCWRYHTVGTQQGEWYLPAVGELGYLASRWKAINNSINKLVSSGVEALVLHVNGCWWSSTEYSSNYAVGLYFSSYYALLYNYRKNYNNYVRAFLTV